MVRLTFRTLKIISIAQLTLAINHILCNLIPSFNNNCKGINALSLGKWLSKFPIKKNPKRSIIESFRMSSLTLPSSPSTDVSIISNKKIVSIVVPVPCAHIKRLYAVYSLQTHRFFAAFFCYGYSLGRLVLLASPDFICPFQVVLWDYLERILYNGIRMECVVVEFLLFVRKLKMKTVIQMTDNRYYFI